MIEYMNFFSCLEMHLRLTLRDARTRPWVTTCSWLGACTCRWLCRHALGMVHPYYIRVIYGADSRVSYRGRAWWQRRSAWSVVWACGMFSRSITWDPRALVLCCRNVVSVRPRSADMRRRLVHSLGVHWWPCRCKYRDWIRQVFVCRCSASKHVIVVVGSHERSTLCQKTVCVNGTVVRELNLSRHYCTKCVCVCVCVCACVRVCVWVR